ncbi:MAG: ABC transporter ATP-binding protein [Elusimicrobiota bacterium]
MPEPLLSIRNLQTRFLMEEYTVRAVDGLSYDLRAGETLAIVGESGSGKSVHALSILQLLPRPPAEIAGGEILYRGRDLLRLDENEVRKLRGNHIAMIFQEPMTSLNPVLPIGEQIAEAVRLHQGKTPEAAQERAIELLQKVGIPAPAKRIHDYPHQFSGGMRQRVMIAIALSCDPDILIADEPTTALDVTIQAQILELMKELQQELRMALVLITHNIGVVAGMADHAVVMYAGRAVEKARVEEIFASPQHPYTRALLQSVPSIFTRKDRLATIQGQPPDLSLPSTGCPFAPRCPQVQERCRTADPPEFMLKGERMSNCWIAEDAAESERPRRRAAAV